MSATVYEIITERVSAALQAGTVPWRRPWRDTDAPRNLEGRLYRGINVFMLLMAGYESPLWMTYNQAKEHGGTIKKGEKGTPVILWKVSPYTKVEADGSESRRNSFVLRYFTVFNLSQTEGVKVPPRVAAGLVLSGDGADPIEEADRVVVGMPNRPAISWGGDRAYYRPSADAVQMPTADTFASPSARYATLFHELGHSTGHKSRLDRPGVTDAHSFGSEPYSREELVAEMTAAFLCGQTGIAPAILDNSAAYIASWLGKLREDPKALVVAAGQAQKAADYILGKAAAEAEPVTEAETTSEPISQAA